MATTFKEELTAIVNGAFEPFCSADELAPFLADLGAEGMRKDVDRCPLANLLTAMMDGRPVVVGTMDVATHNDDGRQVAVTLPWVAQSFIARFDGGEYSYLVIAGTDDDEDDDEDE